MIKICLLFLLFLMGFAGCGNNHAMVGALVPTAEPTPQPTPQPTARPVHSPGFETTPEIMPFPRYEFMPEPTPEPEPTPALEPHYQAIRIHETHPVLTVYTIRGEAVPFYRARGWFPRPYYVTLIITDEYSNYIQTIYNLEVNKFPNNTLPRPHFVDLNFDGYFEMLITRYFQSAMNLNTFLYIWQWDNASGKFVRNYAWEEITDYSMMFTPNPETQLLEVQFIYQRNGHWATYFYAYEDNHFVRIAEKHEVLRELTYVPSYWEVTYANKRTGVHTVEARGILGIETSPRLPCRIIYREVVVNPDLPYTAITARLEMWHIEDIPRGGGTQHYYETVIHISRRMSNGYYMHNYITGLRAGYGVGRWIDIDPDNPLNFHFADYGNNGFLNMAIRKSAPQTGGRADDPHYFWRWHMPANEWDWGFVRSAPLQRITSGGQIVYYGDGYVTVFSWHGQMYNANDTFMYQDGTFFLVRTQRTFWCDDRREMVTVATEGLFSDVMEWTHW